MVPFYGFIASHFPNEMTTSSNMQLVTKGIMVQSTASGLHLVVNHMHQVQKMAPSGYGSLARLMLMTMRRPMASQLLRWTRSQPRSKASTSPRRGRLRDSYRISGMLSGAWFVLGGDSSEVIPVSPLSNINACLESKGNLTSSQHHVTGENLNPRKQMEVGFCKGPSLW